MIIKKKPDMHTLTVWRIRLLFAALVPSFLSAYFSVYMLLYAVSWLLLSLNGFDLLSTFTALSACINNIGPGLGMVGPTGNFSAFAPWAKLLLSFDMLAGRLEIFPMLLLFVPSTWRGNRLRRWERRN